jgi:hypothetical protein
MPGVITKFAVTSMVMWMAPVAIVYGFYYQAFPGSAAVPVFFAAWYNSIYYVQNFRCRHSVHEFYLVMVAFLDFRCESDVILGADTRQRVPGCHIG